VNYEEAKKERDGGECIRGECRMQARGDNIGKMYVVWEKGVLMYVSIGTLRWDFEKHDTMELKDAGRNDGGAQFTLGEFELDVSEWMCDTEYKLYCGKYGHMEEQRRCRICQAIRKN